MGLKSVDLQSGLNTSYTKLISTKIS